MLEINRSICANIKDANESVLVNDKIKRLVERIFR